MTKKRQDVEGLDKVKHAAVEKERVPRPAIWPAGNP